MDGKKKILIVDDDDSMTEVLHIKLGKDYDVISTNAPENVLRLAREQNPHLIICDIDMPDMDGGDISAALHADQNLAHIPFLYLTGLAAPSDLNSKRQELAGRPAISKHSSTQELLARIRILLE